MKSKDDTVGTFATFRVAGDRLEPSEVTDKLKLIPHRAYRKGEAWFQKPGTRGITGRTGMWFLSSEPFVTSSSLADHLFFLVRALGPYEPLQKLMRRYKATASFSGFWHGRAGARAPKIPEMLRWQMQQIPAELELDFATEEDEAPAAQPLGRRAV